MPRNADNEPHWQAIAQRYALEPGPINLENGYFGRMSREVQAQYLEHVAFINRSNSLYVRQRFEQGENVEIRRQLAGLIDVDPEAVAFTRNATEALQSLIRNYNRLQPGDQVLISDLEYDTVKGAMRWLAGVRGVEVIELSHTHPASFDSLVQTYRDAFARYPRLKLMALTHVTHRTGLVMPVEAIAKAAREHAIDVILDGAHALGQIEFNLAELGIAFAGFNLHKWIGAPLTLGFLYIAPECLADIDPDMGEFHYPATDVRARTSYSTPNFPALMTLPLVLEEHRAMGGAAAKGARVSYLRDVWVSQVRPLPGIEVLTPDD
ncbi:MAG TPA: class V aminotransferase, partial [Pseudomonas sp.]|nr:class V aminotransferase [Pseudomonas sp.]